MEYSNFQFIELLAPTDLKTVGANYLFTAEQSCNIVIYPLRTSRISFVLLFTHLAPLSSCITPYRCTIGENDLSSLSKSFNKL